jgi:hypothetical protein
VRVIQKHASREAVVLTLVHLLAYAEQVPLHFKEQTLTQLFRLL